ALTSCQAEAHRLGACLECTANAYRTIDELKAAALNEGRPAGAESVLPPNPNLPPEVPFSAEAFPDAPDAEDALDWIAAAQQINAGDQGQSLHDFAGQMYRMADELTERGKDFSLGDTHWEGKAAESAEDRLRRHESWLYDAAGWAREIAGQAQKLAEAHRVAQQNHPDLQDVENFKKLPMVEQLGQYEEFQKMSEAARQKYASDARAKKIDIEAPPTGPYDRVPVSVNDVPESSADERRDDAAGEGGPGGGGAPGGEGAGGESGTPTEDPFGQPAISPASAAPAGGEQAPAGGETPSSGGGAPAGGSAPAGGGAPTGGGMPSGLPGGLPGGKPEMPRLPTDDPSVKPAA